VVLTLPRVVRALAALALAGCVGPAARPFGEPVTVRITSVDSTRAVQFRLDVHGGAEFESPQMRGVATDARLIASTPAQVTLLPGTTGASFRSLGGGRLDVRAVTGRARLWADGRRVRLESTQAGISISDY